MDVGSVSEEERTRILSHVDAVEEDAKNGRLVLDGVGPMWKCEIVKEVCRRLGTNSAETRLKVYAAMRSRQ